MKATCFIGYLTGMSNFEIEWVQATWVQEILCFENSHKNIMEIFAGKITFLWSSFKVVRDKIINIGVDFSMNT